ncbi:MAG: hypothetical protein J7L82_06950, partial [Staphylothermus sp.]|nr:hypothetical protein [Staphylothermus sp.]
MTKDLSQFKFGNSVFSLTYIKGGAKGGTKSPIDILFDNLQLSLDNVRVQVRDQVRVQDGDQVKQLELQLETQQES